VKFTIKKVFGVNYIREILRYLRSMNCFLLVIEIFSCDICHIYKSLSSGFMYVKKGSHMHKNYYVAVINVIISRVKSFNFCLSDRILSNF